MELTDTLWEALPCYWGSLKSLLVFVGLVHVDQTQNRTAKKFSQWVFFLSNFDTHMGKMAESWIVFVVLSVALKLVFCANNADDLCRVYAGGQVYPQERKLGMEHSLLGTKALSEYF